MNKPTFSNHYLPKHYPVKCFAISIIKNTAGEAKIKNIKSSPLLQLLILAELLFDLAHGFEYILSVLFLLL